ncbi:MAG: toxin-antitoxin system YwqK family antitoxin [Bacteroidia bacterium]|jgi:antitoxin component YwqK of YwqJK toxin-antitoxin module
MKNIVLTFCMLAVSLFFSKCGNERINYSALTNSADGVYFNGELFSGTAFENYRNGNIHAEIEYKNGKKHGASKIWHDNGQLEEETTFSEGKKDGLSKEWYDNGQLKEEETYKQGEKDGTFRRWHSNGKLKSEDLYKDGDLVEKTKYWKEDGTPEDFN